MMINTGTITNVKVSEVGKKDFTKTNKWAYHLDKNYYFAGVNDDGKFEIAWGVDLDNKSATKTYEISYTVVDAISKYEDCAEMYWQFISNDSAIDASEITGTIKLPSKANFKKDIRVWGHVETLNGEIYTTNLDTVEFSLDEHESGHFLEVRIVMPTEMFGTVTRTYNKNMLENIIEEETEWAEEANARRKAKEQAEDIIVAIMIIIAIFFIIKWFKYIKVLIKIKKFKPTHEYKYYREKLNEYSTPADAFFLYNNGKEITATNFGNIFSSTLLNLSLKGYFEILEEKDEKGKKQIVIKKTEKDIAQLKYEEEKIGKFIGQALKYKEKITTEELQNYIKGHWMDIRLLIERTAKEVENKNKSIGNYNEEIKKEVKKYTTKAVCYFTASIILIPLFIASITLFVNAILTLVIHNKMSRLTQKGIDEREKWKGLKRYMQDFSLLNEKEILALEIWEEYLVYATVFGIADKVIKQLKVVYPEIDQMDNFNTHTYIYLMSHTDFNSSFSRSINSSISSTMSSGSGRRRRLLWRWRRRPVAGGSMRRKIIPKNKQKIKLMIDKYCKCRYNIYEN